MENKQILTKTDLKAYSKAIELGQKATIQLIKEKKLTGRGGANFLTGLKWEMALDSSADQKYVICNADEGEPGTFKDKYVFLNNPELVIEGILVAAFAIGAKQAYIYLRGEYDYLKKSIDDTIDAVLEKTGAKTRIDVLLGAGAYVCGDETAIINSIEGYRGQPRQKPPFPTTKGLFGKPTVINNVETLANVSLALYLDDWNPDLRLFSLSGDVTEPGVYELPLGIKLDELMQLGKPKNKIKAIFFGCSGGCIPFSDIELSPEKITEAGAMLGTCSIIAVDETQSIIDLAVNIAKFFESESCGKCTPCREGSIQILILLKKIKEGQGTKKDLDTLQELAEVIQETSFCGLGQTATMHLLTALKNFKEEFVGM